MFTDDFAGLGLWAVLCLCVACGGASDSDDDDDGGDAGSGDWSAHVPLFDVDCAGGGAFIDGSALHPTLAEAVAASGDGDVITLCYPFTARCPWGTH